MATLSITCNDGDIIDTLKAAAARAGFASTNAGVKAMVVAYIKSVYKEQKRLEAQQAHAATVDAAVAAAEAGSAGVS